ncbi:hypothetical protein JTB14_034166 [Gonioctena quinquepunctata]|nr:hypothetical protein JTB14_034166 [Gonioctena quinquepunctata]
MSDCIGCYLENRGILVQVYQDNKHKVDVDICNIINNNHIVVNAKDFLARYHPVSVAVDRMQGDSTTISVSVEIWIQLEMDLKDQPRHIKNLYYIKRNMALGSPHFLANMLDHRFLGQRLTNEDKEKAYEYLISIIADFTPFVSLSHFLNSCLGQVSEKPIL